MRLYTFNYLDRFDPSWTTWIMTLTYILRLSKPRRPLPREPSQSSWTWCLLT